MSRALVFRIILATALYLSIFFAGWFLPVSIGLVSLVLFSSWEVVAGAVIMDLLYANGAVFYGLPIWTISAVLCFFVFRAIRSKLF